MKYGYFKGDHKEYVITRPDTPGSWCNYLGTPAYGAIISNNATGYSFVKSGATGRISRFRFNGVPQDQPGRFIYLRDADSKDFWSGSWQPVGKPLDRYKSECRHGTGYTVITSEYEGIQTETLYYVPMVGLYEVWNCKIKNVSDKPRKLQVYGCVEMTNDSHYEQDQVNLQYTYFITRTYYRDNYILQAINENCSEASSSAAGISDEKGQEKRRFFAAAGADVSSYEGDRDTFIGKYRSYANPVAVENGKCSNTLNYNMNSCGALQFDIELQPGEEQTINFLFGEGNDEIAAGLKDSYQTQGRVEKELNEIIDFWHGKINRLQVETPDDNFNNMVNTWNQYQSYLTFIWSRTASFVYCGLRNGLGYRDTVQDIQGAVHIDPAAAKERLELMLSAQVDNGGGLPLVRWEFKAGEEGTPDDKDWVALTGHPFYRADDALWLFPTVNTYIMETGDIGFLDKRILFANGGEATVYDHLRRAIQFNLDRLGDHGLPAGLHADWNDCLRLGAKGESTFVAFQLYLALNIFKDYAKIKEIDTDIKWCEKLISGLDDVIQKEVWNEDRFVRGFTDDGYTVGHRENKEGSMWLNPQTWAVISGAVKGNQGTVCMDSVYELLNTKYGAAIFAPPFKEYGLPVARMALMNPGTKENGGIFSQTQGWLINAEAILGRGNRAMEYFNEFSPASANDGYEDIRIIEPYAHGQSVEASCSPFFGRGHVHWLTGTASTVMIGLVQGILGIVPDLDGIKIEPCIPSDWKTFKIFRTWRGKQLNVTVDNTALVEKGVVKSILNGKEIKGCYFKESDLKDTNEITLVMG